MNKNSYKDTIEIDLGQFLKKLLVQWRAIVTVGLIFGLVAMTGRYVLDCKNYKASVENAKNAKPTTIEDLENSLSRDDVNTVDNLVRLHYRVKEIDEYFNNSIYIHLDASNVRRIQLYYQIYSLGNADSNDIVANYQVMFSDNAIASKLGKDLGLDVDQKYILELVSVDPQGSNGMVVTLIMCENMDEGLAKNALNNAIENVKALSTSMPHEIELVSESISVTSDRALSSRQYEAEKEIYERKSSLYVNVDDRLSSVQSELFNLKIKQIDEGGEGELVDEDFNASTISKPTLSKSVLLKGFFVGIIVYILLDLLYVLLMNVVADASIVRVTDLPRVGLLSVFANRRIPFLSFLMHDSFIQNLVLKTEIDLSRNENIVGYMQNNAGGKTATHFQVLQIGFDISSDEAMVGLVQDAKMVGVDLTLESINISNVKDIVSKLDGNIPAVIAIYANKTKKYDVRELYGMLRNQNINIVGELHVEEVR